MRAALPSIRGNSSSTPYPTNRPVHARTSYLETPASSYGVGRDPMHAYESRVAAQNFWTQGKDAIIRNVFF